MPCATLAYKLTLEEIALACAEIERTWSSRERRLRGLFASDGKLHALAAAPRKHRLPAVVKLTPDAVKPIGT
jgi:hypothetical protein